VTVGAAKRKTVKITNSFQWLAADLAKARNAGKAIIVLFHDPYEHWSESYLYVKGSKTEGATLKKRDDAAAKSTELTNLLKTYQVSAVLWGIFMKIMDWLQEIIAIQACLGFIQALPITTITS